MHILSFCKQSAQQSNNFKRLNSLLNCTSQNLQLFIFIDLGVAKQASGFNLQYEKVLLYFIPEIVLSVKDQEHQHREMFLVPIVPVQCCSVLQNVVDRNNDDFQPLLCASSSRPAA